ncbi:MAG: transcriptional repressor [bacterium]|nr:transcriptional repressor [bacterium]
MERNTSQKEIILDYLRRVTSHPSAEKVYLDVKNKLPRISRGTVYRNLKILKEKGKVLEIPTDVSRYDGNISNHAHFICQECGKIFDLFDFCDDCKILKNKKTKVGKINKYQMYFYGQCSKCKNGRN